MYQTIWKKEPDRIQQISVDHEASDFVNKVAAAMPILWEEHCTECAVPECYTTCLLFEEREDKKCARFVKGISINNQFSGLFPYGADIEFRRWGKLLAKLPQDHFVAPVEDIVLSALQWDRQQEKALRLSRTLGPLDAKRKLVGASRLAKHKTIGKGLETKLLPDAFVLECFLLGKEKEGLILETSAEGRPASRRILHLDPGRNSFLIHYQDLGISESKNASIEISIAEDRTPRIIFTYLDLVKFVDGYDLPATKVKCVAWDLDNTMWEGVVGDDGAKVKLNPMAKKLVQEFDKIGIIQVVLSKNEEEIAQKKLDEFGLSSNFVSSRINWHPKSQNLTSLAEELNIGIDSFAVIDDSQFERREIRSALSSVRLYPPEEMPALMSYAEFDLDLSPDSGLRRMRYQEEGKRQHQKREWEGDYDDFLRSCRQELSIGKVGELQKDRCFELLQRSNQFNLSGNRYDRNSFEILLANQDRHCKYLSLSDRHGQYGIVGFCSYSFEKGSIRIHDFVFSCRAAEKKVEQAFFHHLWESEVGRNVVARLTATPRNAPLRRVFAEIGFSDTNFENGSQDVTWNEKDHHQDILEVTTI